MENKKQILVSLLITSLISLTAGAQIPKVIVQLKDASQDSFWYPATDNIRFGDKGSTAFMSVDWNRGQGSFFGELKINQGAGFASYRNSIDLDLTSYSKLEIPIKGDGRTYKLLLKDETANNFVNDYSYQAEFKTIRNKMQNINLKISDFKPVYRGQIDETLPALNKAEIRELGLQINDGKPGSYELKFKEWIAK